MLVRTPSEQKFNSPPGTCAPARPEFFTQTKIKPRGGRMKTITVTVVLLILVLSTPSFSQSTYATVSGTVEDPSKALIPGVTMKAVNTATGVSTTVLTNESGTYSFASLLPGLYKVSAE